MIGTPSQSKVQYPNMRRAREAELKQLGARSLVRLRTQTFVARRRTRIRIYARLRAHGDEIASHFMDGDRNDAENSPHGNIKSNATKLS